MPAALFTLETAMAKAAMRELAAAKAHAEELRRRAEIAERKAIEAREAYNRAQLAVAILTR